MLANKLWRRTTARKQAPQREPAWSQPHKPAPVTLSLVLVLRDSSRISRYPAASPESTGLTSGLPLVRRQGREHALQSSRNQGQRELQMVLGRPWMQLHGRSVFGFGLGSFLFVVLAQQDIATHHMCLCSQLIRLRGGKRLVCTVQCPSIASSWNQS